MICCTCHKQLNDRPAIEFQSDFYCYRCAKITLNELDELAKRAHEPIWNAYLQGEQKKFKWQTDYRNYSLPIGLRLFIVFAVAFAFAAFFTRRSSDGPMLFLIGFFIGIGISEFVKNRYRYDWAQKNPEPKSLPYPELKLPSEKIKHVGNGTLGRAYDNYRYMILLRDGYRCQWCGNVFPGEQLEVHHVRPRAQSGNHFDTNLVTLCIDCHIKEKWFGHKHYKAR